MEDHLEGPDAARGWKPVRGLRASEQVAGQILTTFFDGLRPGDWLGTETELAQRFGVSRITMRDAVRVLEARGIVEVKAGSRGGLKIAGADPDRLAEALAVQLHLLGVTREELIEAKQAIEPVTAALAAVRGTEQGVSELRRLVAASREAMTAPERFVEPTLEFHLTIADIAGNRALRTFLASLGREFRVAAPRTPLRLARRVVTMHDAILEAIEAGDAELAAERMREHLTHMAEGRRLPIAERHSRILL